MSAQVIAFPSHRIVRTFDGLSEEQMQDMATRIADRLMERKAAADKERLDALALLIAAELGKAPEAKQPKRKR